MSSENPSTKPRFFDSQINPSTGYWRLEEQIRWYDDESKNAKNWFRILRGTQIVAAASVPAAAYAFEGWAMAPTLLGAVILVSQGFEEYFGYRQNWIKYRNTCEQLKHEKYLYLGRTGPYDMEDDDLRFKELIQRTESFISTENTDWTSHMEHILKSRKQHNGKTASENSEVHS